MIEAPVRFKMPMWNDQTGRSEDPAATVLVESAGSVLLVEFGEAEDVPYVAIERRAPGDWAIMIHLDNGDPSAAVYISDPKDGAVSWRIEDHRHTTPLVLLAEQAPFKASTPTPTPAPSQTPPSPTVVIGDDDMVKAANVPTYAELVKALRKALDYLQAHPPRVNVRTHFHELNEHANGVVKPLHNLLARIGGGG